jgi:hypothetical protein
MRPGALPFHFADGQSAERLVARLAAQGWRGEIRGPHGSGKSTLLKTLEPLLSGAGRRVFAVTLHAGQRRLPRDYLHRAFASQDALVVVDGFEQLSRPRRAWLHWRCRRAEAGLLVTSHVATGLPVLIQLQPDLALVQQLAAQLAQRESSVITMADVAASHACRGSNVRETFFDLYDRHERVSRAARTAPSAAT